MDLLSVPASAAAVVVVARVVVGELLLGVGLRGAESEGRGKVLVARKSGGKGREGKGEGRGVKGEGKGKGKGREGRTTHSTGAGRGAPGERGREGKGREGATETAAPEGGRAVGRGLSWVRRGPPGRGLTMVAARNRSDIHKVCRRAVDVMESSCYEFLVDLHTLVHDNILYSSI